MVTCATYFLRFLYTLKGKNKTTNKKTKKNNYCDYDPVSATKIVMRCFFFQ